MAYTTPDEDRSDLYLAGAVYFIGPTILQLILGSVSMPPVLGRVVGFASVIATTVLVPFLLIRYRKERIVDFGFAGSKSSFGPALVAALPVTAAIVIGNLIAGSALLAGIPVAVAAGGDVIDAILHVVAGVCVVLLAIYATVKARSAFRSDPRYIRTAMVELGRIVGIAGAATAVLLFISLVVQDVPVTTAVLYLIIPIGVAGCVWLVHRGAPASQLTSRPILITPMVILGLASLQLLGGAFEFVAALWNAAMLAALGLALGALLEARRSAWAPLGLGVGLVLFTTLIR